MRIEPGGEVPTVHEPEEVVDREERALVLLEEIEAQWTALASEAEGDFL
jgi:hypothetical protein